MTWIRHAHAPDRSVLASTKSVPNAESSWDQICFQEKPVPSAMSIRRSSLVLALNL